MTGLARTGVDQDEVFSQGCGGGRICLRICQSGKTMQCRRDWVRTVHRCTAECCEDARHEPPGRDHTLHNVLQPALQSLEGLAVTPGGSLGGGAWAVLTEDVHKLVTWGGDSHCCG